MATIWFASAPLVSHTDWGGFLKTALALQQAGHDVIWISTEKLKRYVTQAGIQFEAVPETGFLWPPPPPPDLTRIDPREAVNLRYTRALDTWLSEDIVTQATDALIDLADRIEKPDLIAIDPFLSAAALAAEALDVPIVSCGWPAQGDLNAMGLFPVQRTLGTESQQRIHRLCEHFGLEGVNFSKGPTPSIISPHLHICYFTQNWYIAEINTLLSQNVFVGGYTKPVSSEPPGWLLDIPEDAGIGMVTLGSSFTGDLGFYSWAAHAVARAGLIPVVAIGWNPIKPEKKRELINALPPTTRLLNWVPFDHVLPRSKIMIHHGGMGTTHYAVVHGLPQIVVPHAADQRVQAKRVAQAKVGLNLSAHDVQKGLLLEGTGALLEDEKVQQTAHLLARQMAALGGPDVAAQHIERVIQMM